MNAKNFSLLTSVLLLAGCTVPNQARYQVFPASATHPTATPADQAAVKEIIQTAAKTLKLEDMTASSIVPNTIAYFQQVDSNTPVKLIAWNENGKILIELMHWPDTLGETLPFRSTREYIESELKQRFGDRASVVAFKKLVAKTPSPH